MRQLHWIVLIALTACVAVPALAATPEELASQQALLRSMEIKLNQLMPLNLETPIVADGKAVAVICHADDPAWSAVAIAVQKAVADATGCTLSLVTDAKLPPADFLKQPVILIGNLDNNRHVARLYHNFFVCSDAGYTGRTGYELRSVHNPFGTGQNAIAITPATPEASVYVAECEIRGLRQGRYPEITALTRGDLNGDGTPEVIVASDTGACRALDASGKVLWEYSGKERARVYSLACADVDGDGREEVMFGQGNATLGLLSGDGKLLWTANPPTYRSIKSDVITVFPGDVNGDKRPEIICGCLSWQYFAYDAQGEMIWRNVIYAHSATVGAAADLNGDAKDEVVAGDVYYTLNVIGNDGVRLWNSSSIGPEITAVAATDVTGDGTPEVFAGVDGGTLFAYAADRTPLWQANLGDKITRLLPLDVDGDGKQELICAAESAQVFAVTGEGKILWRTALPDGCGDMATDGKRIVVSCGAGVAVLSPDGKVASLHLLKARAGSLVLVGDQAVVTQDTGTLAVVKLN